MWVDNSFNYREVCDLFLNAVKKEPQVIDHMVTADVIYELIFVLSFVPDLLCTY
jgi:hypothetical protein